MDHEWESDDKRPPWTISLSLNKPLSTCNNRNQQTFVTPSFVMDIQVFALPYIFWKPLRQVPQVLEIFHTNENQAISSLTMRGPRHLMQLLYKSTRCPLGSVSRATGPGHETTTTIASRMAGNAAPATHAGWWHWIRWPEPVTWLKLWSTEAVLMQSFVSRSTIELSLENQVEIQTVLKRDTCVLSL